MCRPGPGGPRVGRVRTGCPRPPRGPRVRPARAHRHGDGRGRGPGRGRRAGPRAARDPPGPARPAGQPRGLRRRPCSAPTSMSASAVPAR
ncbi:hypothetical protein M3700_01300 [Micrococcus luteus]|nr:hypothetical protein [Micrococcus luteus]